MITQSSIRAPSSQLSPANLYYDKIPARDSPVDIPELMLEGPREEKSGREVFEVTLLWLGELDGRRINKGTPASTISKV